MNDRLDIFNRKIGSALTIDLVSPLHDDDLAEHRDSNFLKVLDLGHLQNQFKNFWPNSGPLWAVLVAINDTKTT